NTVQHEQLLGQSELCKLLTAALQKQYVMGDGQLELQLMRSWDARKVPDGPLSLNILEMPNTGISTYFLVRFELRAGGRSLGNWQMPVQAHLWQKIWVARSNLNLGDSLAGADITLERRDVLTLHSALVEFTPGDTGLELAESVPAGSPILARSVKLRPVIFRGQMADALVQDGALSVTLKVQVLESGAPGQIIHVRNLESGRSFCGKVLNNQTVVVPL
ncbi:MAG TPA: flagellar basal body P-ring formation chaperone FlgA, partial [Candidatus Saccharimonadales bacterium]|nr:flagellar basal body P-ring formation chaperone FlgA [Candidatus Saccharimonadales bacterium]